VRFDFLSSYTVVLFLKPHATCEHAAQARGFFQCLNSVHDSLRTPETDGATGRGCDVSWQLACTRRGGRGLSQPGKQSSRRNKQQVADRQTGQGARSARPGIPRARPTRALVFYVVHVASGTSGRDRRRTSSPRMRPPPLGVVCVRPPGIATAAFGCAAFIPRRIHTVSPTSVMDDYQLVHMCYN